MYVENLWDWGFLRKYLGNFGIEPTDLDGIIERNGRFLLLEAKSPGAKIPGGQRFMFDNLVKMKCPYCDQDINLYEVLVIWGKPNQPEQMQMWRIQSTPVPASVSAVQKVVGDWYVQACKKGLS